MIGAVVGVQPFGGDGLSGTGPKAGGPLYLRRLLQAAPSLPTPEGSPVGDGGAVRAAAIAQLRELRQTLAEKQPVDALLSDCDALIAATPLGRTATLPGPTGERNTYALVPRRAVLTIAQTHADRMYQFAAVLAAGARALWIDTAESRAALAELPPSLRARVELAPDPLAAGVDLETAWVQADALTVRDWSLRLAQRPGAIVPLHASAPGERAAPFERLLVERSVSVNTAAAGGNASLMTLG
jgi:RHH-type transcriptional regulator, proline utilization regulon repressor / proline dehydrogenase / delta 1-pyrroline-5-carboxylate dehydrogenase